MFRRGTWCFSRPSSWPTRQPSCCSISLTALHHWPSTLGGQTASRPTLLRPDPDPAPPRRTTRPACRSATHARQACSAVGDGALARDVVPQLAPLFACPPAQRGAYGSTEPGRPDAPDQPPARSGAPERAARSVRPAPDDAAERGRRIRDALLLTGSSGARHLQSGEHEGAAACVPTANAILLCNAPEGK